MPRIKFGYDSNYIKVYGRAQSHFNLRPIEGLLLGLVESMSSQKGYCYATKETLAGILNVNTSTVYYTMNKLIRKGLLISKPVGFSKAQLMCTDEWYDFIGELRQSFSPDD